MKVFAVCFVALFAGAIAAPRAFENIEEIEDKIIGGNATTIQEYPYQLSLRANGRHNCGASVLTPTRGLSVAHCFRAGAPPAMYSIKAGSTFRLDVPNDPNAQIRPLSRFILHPEWHRPTIRNDIAVVHWVQPLVFGANVQPVVLPLPTHTVPYGNLVVTSGWGLTREGQGSSVPNILQAVATPLVSNPQCLRFYPNRITVDMLCAGFPQGGRATCHGDSGGPLVDRSSGRFVQLGAVSWARGCARPNAPSVYARVPHFHAWIRQNM